MHYLKENQNQTKEVDMPSVGGQNFDYTPEGLAAAQQAARAKGQTLSGSKDDVIGMDDAGNKINPLGRSIDSFLGQLVGRPAIPPMTRGDGRIRAEDAQRLIEAGIAPDMGMDDVLDDADDNIDINYGTGFDDDNMAPDALDMASVGGDVGSDIGIGSDSNRRLAGVVAPRKPMEYPDNIASRGALPTPEKGYETPDGTSIFGANIEEAMNADRASGPSLLEQFKNFLVVVTKICLCHENNKQQILLQNKHLLLHKLILKLVLWIKLETNQILLHLQQNHKLYEELVKYREHLICRE